LHSKMESWNASLAEHLRFDPLRPQAVTPPPHVLSLAYVESEVLQDQLTEWQCDVQCSAYTFAPTLCG
jgi:hypothetical protein